jgi:hypothetical protein
VAGRVVPVPVPVGRPTADRDSFPAATVATACGGQGLVHVVVVPHVLLVSR